MTKRPPPAVDPLADALDALAGACATFSRLALADFRASAPAGYGAFSEAFAAGLLDVQVEVALRADGGVSAARIIALSRNDARRTVLASIA